VACDLRTLPLSHTHPWPRSLTPAVSASAYGSSSATSPKRKKDWKKDWKVVFSNSQQPASCHGFELKPHHSSYQPQGHKRLTSRKKDTAPNSETAGRSANASPLCQTTNPSLYDDFMPPVKPPAVSSTDELRAFANPAQYPPVPITRVNGTPVPPLQRNPEAATLAAQLNILIHETPVLVTKAKSMAALSKSTFEYGRLEATPASLETLRDEILACTNDFYIFHQRHVAPLFKGEEGGSPERINPYS
jgi:hypothetical protein